MLLFAHSARHDRSDRSLMIASMGIVMQTQGTRIAGVSRTRRAVANRAEVIVFLP
jgi:hypothetical protein